MAAGSPMAPHATPTRAAAVLDAAEPVPVAVWACAQTTGHLQRAGRYLSESTAHPGKMLPELARRITTEYAPPGGLVVDPMCGIGTTLVEAAHLGRVGLGVEREPRWANLARANLAHAATQGATGTGTVTTGDARQLLDLLDPSLHGQVVLVVTSPPYGPSIHGQVDARPGGVVKYDNRYAEPGATGRGNLARASDQVLLGAMQQILAACCILLRPGGGPSFFQLGRVRKARAAGLPLRVIAHEDVLVFRRSQTCAGS